MNDIIEALTSYKGRMRRMTFFIYKLILFFTCVALACIFMLTLLPHLQPNETQILLLKVAGAIIYFYFHLALSVKRCHDFGKTGLLTILSFVPIVGFFFGLFLLFKRGDAGPNQYGLPPV